MSGILVAQANDPHMQPKVLQGMFQLRDEIFHKRLRWDVKSYDGMERDDYDDLDPTYMVASDDRWNVHGCWRLLPTTGPYMLKDTFGQLLRGEPAPQDPYIWELSRFAVKPTSKDDCRQANFGIVTFQMMQKAFDYAQEHDIHSYVTVTSVALERMLRKAGIPMRRFGDGKAVKIGKVLSVACWIDINEEVRRAVYGNFELPQQEVA